MREVWPACLVSGATFGLFQFLVSNYHGPWLVDIIAAIVSILSLVAAAARLAPADDVAVRPRRAKRHDARPAPHARAR